MLEPCSSNQKKGLLVARSLINNEGESKISVLNITDKPIKLKPGDTLGNACPVTENCQENEIIDNSEKKPLPEHLQPLVEGLSPELTSEEKQQFIDLITEYQDIFVGPDKKLGQTDLAYHKIDVGNVKPIKIPPRKCPLAQREIINEELDKMLEQNVVEPSDSPWSAPICLVKKSDGTYRFAIDFRGLNSVTEKDAYPLPNIRQIFDTLSGSKWYNTIDCASGYWQVPLHPDSKKYTAFATPTRGLFHFLVMSFGLSNAGSTFERLVENVLGPLQWEKCICYLDDVIIFGSDFKTTLDNLRAVFSRFRMAKLRLKTSKCKFFQREISFLGHIATENGTLCDPEKTAAIQNWPRPKNAKEIRSFLGLVNFYRSYIKDCATLAFPLNNLTRKHVRFKWDEKCEESFNALKQCLMTPPILAYPTRTGKFILQTDSSGYGIGAILSQEQDGREVVISYGSKTLNKSQQNYCTTMRELYAVVYFMRYYKHYLMGRHFEVHTDHASLVWIKNFKDADGMLARWLTIIDTFDFSIFHKKASQMHHVDALSRIPPRRCKRDACMDCHGKRLNDSMDPEPSTRDLASTCNSTAQQSKDEVHANIGGTLSTENIVVGTLSTEEVGPRTDTSSTSVTNSDESHSPNWLGFKGKEELRELQMKDPDIAIVLQSKESQVKPSKETINGYNQTTKTLFHHWDALNVKEGVLYKSYDIGDDSHLVLVAPSSIRYEIFESLHNDRMAGHFGRDRTLEMIKRRFYWPNISDTVQRWCASCDMCEKCKPGPGVGKSPLKQIKVSRRFQVIALDIFGPLPITDNSNEYIVVIADYFTKFTEAFAIPNHTALTVADKLVTEVILRYGCPEQIHSDMGAEFESNLFREICRLLDVKKSRTCPYRPQCDAVVERFNRTLKQMLAIFCHENKHDWDDYLPYLMFAYRSSIHASTKHSPNFLMFGQEVNCPVDLMYGPPPDRVNYECPIEYAEWLYSAMRSVFQTVRDNLKVAAQRQKFYYDRGTSERQFQVGTFVWRIYPPLAEQKVEVDWDGPFLVVKKISDLTYKIQKSPTSRKFNVNVNHLKSYMGENSPRPWVGPDGEPIPGVNMPISPEIALNEQESRPVNGTVEPDNLDSPQSTLQSELLPLEQESFEYQEEPYESPSRQTLVRTRVGRAVKPRQIYSP